MVRSLRSHQLATVVVLGLIPGCQVMIPADGSQTSLPHEGAYTVVFTSPDGTRGWIGDISADGDVLAWEKLRAVDLDSGVIASRGAAFIGGTSPNVYSVDPSGVMTKSTLGEEGKMGATTATIADSDATTYYASQNIGGTADGYVNKLLELTLDGQEINSATVPGFVTSIATTGEFVVTSGQITQDSNGLVVHTADGLNRVREISTVSMPMRCFPLATGTAQVLCAENPPESRDKGRVNDMATVLRTYDLNTGAHEDFGQTPVELIDVIDFNGDRIYFTQEEVGSVVDGQWVAHASLGDTIRPYEMGNFVKIVQRIEDVADVFVFRSPYTAVDDKLDAGKIVRIDLNTKKVIRETPIIVPKTGGATMQFLPQEFFDD